MTNINHAVPTGTALCTCADDQDVRILRRVSTLGDFPLREQATGAVRRVAVVDTETTGTDVINDEIIDIAVVVIEVGRGWRDRRHRQRRSGAARSGHGNPVAHHPAHWHHR